MITESISQQQLSLLEKKLAKAIESKEDLAKDLASKESLFMKFISKLSLVCRGIDLELDRKLADFRQLHKKSEPLEVLVEQIAVISELLQQQSNKNDISVQKIHADLIASSKTLQQSKGLPDKTRRDLRAFIKSLDSSKPTTIQYVPILHELLALYEQTLKAKGVMAATSAPVEKVAESDVTTTFLIKLKEQIVNAINGLNLSEKNQKDLLQAKKQILASSQYDDVLTYIVNVFSVITLDLQQERDTEKLFLSSLNETLSNVQKAVLSTLSCSNKVKKQNTAMNNKIQAQLSSVSSDLKNANSLTVVKNDINDKLNIIVNLLNEKQKFEDSSAELISNQLTEMTERVKTLENESKKFQTRLEEQLLKSMQDALTKLSNRAAFDEYFTKALVRFHHNPFELAIVVIDLDNFKQINDTYGHTAGDKTLQVIANTLRKNIDKKAFVGRYGGEEFVLVFSDLNKEKLTLTLNEVRKKIALLPFTFKNNKVSITTSIGCTHVKHGDNIHQAFERADQALYQAKEQGKNRVIYKS